MPLSPTLQAFDDKVEGIRDRAKRVQKLLTDRIAEIESDPNLSDEGKKSATSEAKLLSKDELTRLRAEEESAVNEALDQLERRIEGQVGYSSTDIITFRDAQDRAERLKTSDEAERVLVRAIRSNDRTLAHAVFRRALEANWPTLVKIFADHNPSAAEAAQDMRTLTRFRDRSMERSVIYGVLAWAS